MPTDDDYRTVLESLTAIIAEARVALGILTPRGVDDAVIENPIPDEYIDLVAAAPRVREARQGVKHAHQELLDAGVPFPLRTGFEAAYEALLAATMQAMWEQQG